MDHAVDALVLTALLLILVYGCYAVWDSNQIFQAADEAQYRQYKPTKDDSLSFDELRKINGEVFGWITLDDTNIDYPLVQGTDNSKYVNTDAKGAFSLSGSLFLDYRNARDFSDFTSIIYGHHMEKRKMFGDISSFRDKAWFDGHQYGSIFDGKTVRGLEIFAFLDLDAYDELYEPLSMKDSRREEYLQAIFDKAMHLRKEKNGQTNVTAEDSIVLLSTCDTKRTNGRWVLAAKITDEEKGQPETRRMKNE